MPKTLLLADDSVTIQKVVGISFANEDVKLLTVDNGDDAIARAREARPDIVLADVVMPGRSGYEVCEAIKSDPQLSHVPVLLLTGTFEAFDEARARQAGADGHITKPFEAQALVSQVNELLSRPRPAPAASAAAPPPAAASAPAGAAPAAAPAPGPTASPASRGDSGDAYDFFDDDLSGELGAPEPAAAEEPTETTGDAGFDLGSPGLDDFAIGGDDSLELDSAPELELATPPPAPAPAPDRTVALMPDEPEPVPSRSAPQEPAARPASPTPPPVPEADPAATLLADFDAPVAEPAPPPVPPAAAQPPAAPPATPTAPAPSSDPAETVLSDDLFGGADRAADELANALPPAGSDLDFAFDDAPTAPPANEAPAALAEPPETVLEPGAAAAYDVSSSDLGDSFARTGRGPTRTPEAPVEPAPSAARPARQTAPERDTTTLSQRPFGAAEGPAAAAPEAAAAPPPESVAAPEPAGPAAPQRPAGPPGPAAAELTAVMRERLHETLERVAWDAFADLSEQIVKQVLDRVEKIAWEVIPQMAETLIQEEIRRMKGEDEG